VLLSCHFYKIIPHVDALNDKRQKPCVNIIEIANNNDSIETAIECQQPVYEKMTQRQLKLANYAV
jgi:hypothetical protein